MDARDAKRFIDWGVNLVGRVIFFGALVAFVSIGLAGTTGDRAWLALLALWPAVVGVWLWLARAPWPVFVDEDEEIRDA